MLKTIQALVRLPFATLLVLCFALGAAQTTTWPGALALGLATMSVLAWMLCAVALNDLLDEPIDRVNLAHDPQRTLVAGTATRTRLWVIAGASALVALTSAAFLNWTCLAVTGIGLLLAAAYSLPPLLLSRRGALTAALLPLGYVGVPFLLGAFCDGGTVTATGWFLLAGLYLGFMGRLVLKDFRDELGDRLYGKRTFLVRHGRIATAWFSGTFVALGALVALIGLDTPGLWIASGAALVSIVIVLRSLARDTDGVRDVANISAYAYVGRAMLLVYGLDLAARHGHWSTLAASALIVAYMAVAITNAFIQRAGASPRRDTLSDTERATLAPPAPDARAELSSR